MCYSCSDVAKQAGTYTEFMTVFANVFLGMQLALSSYLQVCFSITNDVVMSISLMYEKPEAGQSICILDPRTRVSSVACISFRPHASEAAQRSYGPPDGLAILRPDIPSAWSLQPSSGCVSSHSAAVHRTHDVAVRDEHVVPLDAKSRPRLLRRDPGVQ